jgi:hypothetical protein
LAPSRRDDGSEPAIRTKAGQHDDAIAFGDAASCAAGRSRIASLLQHLKTTASSPASLLFPISLARYEELFRRAARSLGLGKLKCTPHSARHGGPSSDYARGLRNLLDIQKRGHWGVASSVRRYEKSATLMRQLSLLDSQQIDRSVFLQNTILEWLCFSTA